MLLEGIRSEYIFGGDPRKLLLVIRIHNVIICVGPREPKTFIVIRKLHRIINQAFCSRVPSAEPEGATVTS